MASVTANGITIEYDERGQGEPLLLVMGVGGQLSDWPEGFVDLVAAQGFRVIRFDNRDAGLSTEFDWAPPSLSRIAVGLVTRHRPKAGYLLSDMANDAVALLDALGIDAAHLVGVSMGGMIVQSIAIEHPQRARSLTSIMSTTGHGRVGRPRRKLLWKITRMGEPTRETALERSVTMFRMISGHAFDEAEYRPLAQASIARSYRPVGAARQLAAIMASPDRTKALGRVSAPTLVVHGLADPLVQPSGGIATARAVPGSRLVMYPEMGHDLPRGRWEEIAVEIATNARRAERT